ncbi:MAG: hypothetical protein J7K87_01280 [Candidatus Aenigmarchaeota archaeon]|nr:hypothetical protein [Candidatus Aenigmarchaeota archaeon]
MWERVMLQPLDLEEIGWIIREHIKSACEFYLRYKDKPHLLIREYPKYEKQARKFLDEDDIEGYNDWLFRLAFKEVLDGE